MEYLVKSDDQYYNENRPYQTREIFIAQKFPAFQRYQIRRSTFQQRCSSCGELRRTPIHEHVPRCKQHQIELDYQYIKESNEFNNLSHSRLYSQNEDFRRYVRGERLFERTLVIPAVVSRIDNRIKKAIEAEWCVKAKALFRKRLGNLNKSPTCLPVLGCNSKTGDIIFYPTK